MFLSFPPPTKMFQFRGLALSLIHISGSEKVATFASAFEKYRFLQISRGFTIKELEMILCAEFQ